jgi:anhydro-N-acetylmuramic acid kinase
MAASGKIVKSLYEKLNSWAYYNQEPPKSLDKEKLLTEVMPSVANTRISLNDRLATFCEHIAFQVANAIPAGANGRMLITGGGAFNRFLVSCIQANVPDIECIVPDAELISYKEALIFAFLGLLRVLGEINTLQTVTGAERDSAGGALYGHFNG